MSNKRFSQIMKEAKRKSRVVEKLLNLLGEAGYVIKHIDDHGWNIVSKDGELVGEFCVKFKANKAKVESMGFGAAEGERDFSEVINKLFVISKN